MENWPDLDRSKLESTWKAAMPSPRDGGLASPLAKYKHMWQRSSSEDWRNAGQSDGRAAIMERYEMTDRYVVDAPISFFCASKESPVGVSIPQNPEHRHLQSTRSQTSNKSPLYHTYSPPRFLALPS